MAELSPRRAGVWQVSGFFYSVNVQGKGRPRERWQRPKPAFRASLLTRKLAVMVCCKEFIHYLCIAWVIL